MTLEHLLDRIDESSNKIQEYKFPKYGMFTNAVIDPQDIMTLLKDASQEEALLYISRVRQKQPGELISGTTLLQRRDGGRLLKEQNYFDFSDDPDTPLVRVPQSAPFSRHLEEPIIPLDSESNDLEYLIQWNKQVLEKFPSLLSSHKHIQEFVEYEQEYIERRNSIIVLEQEINRDKELVNRIEGLGNVHDKWEEDRALDAFIQMQQEEIRELEARLTKPR